VPRLPCCCRGACCLCAFAAHGASCVQGTQHAGDHGQPSHSPKQVAGHLDLGGAPGLGLAVPAGMPLPWELKPTCPPMRPWLIALYRSRFCASVCLVVLLWPHCRSSLRRTPRTARWVCSFVAHRASARTWRTLARSTAPSRTTACSRCTRRTFEHCAFVCVICIRCVRLFVRRCAPGVSSEDTMTRKPRSVGTRLPLYPPPPLLAFTAFVTRC
jgi:hypothetical protein